MRFCIEILLFGLVVPEFGCGPSCGSGTVDHNGSCVASYDEIVCAAGTTLANGSCVASYDKVVCAAGTTLANGSCVASYDEIVCAPGTTLANGNCTPDFAAVCGAGTLESSGRCLPLYVLSCGPGTLQVENRCEPDSSANPNITCGTGAVLRDGVCVGLSTQAIAMPFASGASVLVTQSANGYDSHHGYEQYAVDFGVPLGTDIAAARGGRVLASRSDSTVGCATDTCVGDANYIVIDHGDGTFGQYWHLQQNGVKVALGDSVCRGQLIGRSGNTGFSTGPHLHFAIVDVWQQTLPLFFDEAKDNGGALYAGSSFTSANVTPASCGEAHAYSDCATDTFLTRGVLMDAGVPCAVATPGSTYIITGTSLSSLPFVQLARYRTSSSDWEFDCASVGAGGHYSVTVSWPTPAYASYGMMMLSAAEPEASAAGCKPPEGWWLSPKVYLR